ncbi:cell wall-binding repeat-containing protein [Agromyces mediolanus]|uniref:cell wall-binding repeat-containing protein n=1 Tax=Agromyces mediolanus TaxID=41986 RepID=UPI0038335F97
MTRRPRATPWRATLAAAACLALTAFGALPANAAEDEPLGRPVPTAEAPSSDAGDPLAPRTRDLGVSAAAAAAELSATAGTQDLAPIAAATGSISGTVTKMTGAKTKAPLAGAVVSVHPYQPSSDTLPPAVATATSAANGTYTVTGVPAGQYLALFRDPAKGTKLLPDFWRNAAYATSATPITVSDGQTATGIDEMLAPLLSGYIAGADRYETSAAIAEDFPVGVDCVYLASGANFPDALSAAPAAATCGGPLLLVQPTALPAKIAAQLTRLKPAKVFIAGGTGAVSAKVEQAVKARVPSASIKRLAGKDRYGTSRAIVDTAFGTSQYVWIATGVDFPDALAASNAAAAYREPVLIVPGRAAKVDAATMQTVANRQPDAVVIAGGTGAVSTGIENQLWWDYGKLRLSGKDRYGTSMAINDWAWNTPGSSSVYAFITNGTKFPDALSGAALAGGRYGAPMYTVPPNCVPNTVQQHISELRVYEAYLIGYFSKISFAEPLKRC